MVIAGDRTQCRGVGTINGKGNYGFFFTVTDGEILRGRDSDKFRMKIWNNTNGTLIYDNQLGTPDTAAAMTAISGGSIVIHPVEPGLALAKNENSDMQVDVKPIPHEYALHQNYPNPFNPITIIRYDLPAGSLVTLTVYDLLGREVTTVVDAYQSAGEHVVRFNGEQLASGAYIYRLTAGPFVQTKKLMVVK